MKTFLKTLIFLLACQCYYSITGCKSLKESLQDSIGAATDTLNNKSNSIGDSLAAGLLKRFKVEFKDSISPMVQKDFANLLGRALDSTDAKLKQLGTTAAAVHDSLFSEEIKKLLKEVVPEHILGKATRQNWSEMMKLAKGVLPGKNYLSDMLKNASDQAIQDTAKLQLLLVSLLSKQFEDRVDSIVAGVVTTAKNNAPDILNEPESFLKKVKKYALQILLGVFGLILAAAGFAAYKYARYMRLFKTLTFQIHNMPNQQEYDKLTEKIQSEAKRNSVEPLLKKILAEQGLYHNWKPSQR